MSKLDDYIGKLLKDDDALKHFLVDPISASEDANGLSKAQRSVLRRVVANLSNNATNGYGVVRSLDSYRRSIRMLQNVMHLERGHAVATNVNLETNDVATQHAIFIYYNGIPENPAVNNPYAHYLQYAGYGATIGQVMATAKDKYGNSLKTNFHTITQNGMEYVDSFTIPSQYSDPGTYQIDLPDNLKDKDAFWFYSIFGRAISGGYRYGKAGGKGESFVNYPLPANSTIYWQVIAPDTSYGFQPCDGDSVEKVFGITDQVLKPAK